MKQRGKLITVAVALAIVLAAAAGRGGFNAADRLAGFQIWSDAFFIAGVLLAGVGVLAFASSDGLFDIIRYGVGKVVRLVLSEKKRSAYPKTFYDYRLMRRGKGMNGTFLMVVGAACLALAGLFLYFNMHG